MICAGLREASSLGLVSLSRNERWVMHHEIMDSSLALAESIVLSRPLPRPQRIESLPGRHRLNEIIDPSSLLRSSMKPSTTRVAEVNATAVARYKEMRTALLDVSGADRIL